MSREMFAGTPMEDDYRKLAADPDGFPALVEKLIALEHEPMAWEEDVKALKTPVLITTGDADVTTLEHSVSIFRLRVGGIMGDMGANRYRSRACRASGDVSHGGDDPAAAAACVHRAVPRGRVSEVMLP